MEPERACWGLESDESYCFEPEKLAAVAEAKARKSLNSAEYPNPDLSIEIDISPPKVDRPGIYAALHVAELWRFDGETEQVIIERLGDDGAYHPVDGSGFLPIRAEEVRHWVIDENSDDEAAWAERLRPGRGRVSAATGSGDDPRDSQSASDRHPRHHEIITRWP